MEVAVTVRLAAVSPAAMVSSPASLITVPAPPPETAHVTVCTGLPVPFTVAVKVWAPPLPTLAVAGFTVTPLTVASPVTVTIAVPD
ncbi:MAG: hypothetical protein LBF63_07180, partial [Treponema sp.]|nr:hypothetical protein [Treponema sp.]